MVELEKLSPLVITSIETYASEHALEKEKRGYKTAIAELSQMYGISKDTVCAILDGNINEQWKKVKGRFNRYKISSYGRVKGPKGNIVRQYINNSGAEQIDPYDSEGKRGHLAIKKAICDAFFTKPKVNKKFVEKFVYTDDMKKNTIYGIHLVRVDTAK